MEILEALAFTGSAIQNPGLTINSQLNRREINNENKTTEVPNIEPPKISNIHRELIEDHLKKYNEYVPPSKLYQTNIEQQNNQPPFMSHSELNYESYNPNNEDSSRNISREKLDKSRKKPKSSLSRQESRLNKLLKGLTEEEKNNFIRDIN